MISHPAQHGAPRALVARGGLPIGAAIFDADGPLDTPEQRATGRFCALAVEPEAVLRWDFGDVGDPFDLLAAFAPTPTPCPTDWPCPLVACALAYDLGRVIERLPAVARIERHAPALWAARYRAVYVWDRLQRTGRIFGRDAQAVATLDARLSTWPTHAEPPRIGAAHAETEWAAYAEKFKQIQGHIRAGDVYQINFALRFVASAEGDPGRLFDRLHRRSPVPFAAGVRMGAHSAVLSISPERFLAWDAAGRVETRPIKGTRPRGVDPAADARWIQDLQASPKDAAEHVMIVDLQRNDLGRICQAGTVRVRQHAGVESYATVHHLVSIVEGQRRDPMDLAGLLRATFPGGSITGAPKISAMGIIDALEPVRRGLYCGSIGYLDARGGGDLNIAIRTAILAEGRLHYSAGGGIVADSQAEAEWAEAWQKARAFIEACGEA